MSTFTDTFNRDDIRRVYASFAADYKIVAEWTELHSPAFVEQTIAEIKAIAEEQYLKEVHLQLALVDRRHPRGGRLSRDDERVPLVGRQARRPLLGQRGRRLVAADRLLHQEVVGPDAGAQRNAFAAVHMVGWGTSDFDGNYAGLTASTDKRFASRAYGMERTRHSS